MRSYPTDVLGGDDGHRRHVPEVVLRRGLVIEVLGDGFVGQAVGLRKGQLVLEDRRGRKRSFALSDQGFLINDEPVHLIAPEATPPKNLEPETTTSGSIAVTDATARVAQPSRIFVEGVHDAEIIERVWGHDLRVEGLVVEVLDGIDDLVGVVRSFAPSRRRRLGILVDHFVPGTKEWRIVEGVTDPNVLVTGHPYVDVWEAVKPSALGIERWPRIPKGRSWKDGVAAALGEPDPQAVWRRVLAAVSVYTDLEPSMVGAVEQLIDFLTEPIE